MQAVFQPQGGILASERCIAAHIKAAQQQGAQVHLHEKVCGWRVDPRTQDVLVSTDKAQYRAGRLVITGGAWMSQLVPELQVLHLPLLLSMPGAVSFTSGCRTLQVACQY